MFPRPSGGFVTALLPPAFGARLFKAYPLPSAGGFRGGGNTHLKPVMLTLAEASQSVLQRVLKQFYPPQ